jgi:serine phosphatase RsbU (regulator of sigma subunit)
MMGYVTGHGAGPAMVTGIAKAAFDVAVAWRGELVTCDDILGAMNAAVYRAARGKMLMTCVASVIDPAQRTVSVTNAGHVFPMLVRRSAGGWQLRELVARGSPLGSAEAADLDTSVIDLAPEDTLVWYTDGLTDCENVSRAQFGRKRLARSLRRESSTTPVDIRDRILLDLRQFSGERPPADDITFAVARIKPHGPA